MSAEIFLITHPRVVFFFLVHTKVLKPTKIRCYLRKKYFVFF
ncbi:hypothetical protein ECDEC7B_1195 [Escherichia coli DEC7B]|nr:hypothetical protein ECDEC7B_1195 [Escherichia coli DEC7B]